MVNPGNHPALLEAILEITESAFPYRRRYLTQFEKRAVVDLLLAEASNPRSVAFQLATIAQHLGSLPRDISHPDRGRDQQLLMGLRTSIQTAHLAEWCEVLTEQPQPGLAEFLRSRQQDGATLRRHRPFVLSRHGIAGRFVQGEEPHS